MWRELLLPKNRFDWDGALGSPPCCIDKIGCAYDQAMDLQPTPAETCFTRAWREHQAEIEGYLRRRVGDGGQAADLLQTVFLEALPEGRNFRNLRKPRAASTSPETAST